MAPADRGAVDVDTAASFVPRPYGVDYVGIVHFSVTGGDSTDGVYFPPLEVYPSASIYK